MNCERESGCGLILFNDTDQEFMCEIDDGSWEQIRDLGLEVVIVRRSRNEISLGIKRAITAEEFQWN